MCVFVGYYGDGSVCYTERNCHNDPGLCDSHAICITNAARQYYCECQRGYVGNGTICKESPRHEGNFLLLNQGRATWKISFDPSKSTKKPIHISLAVGLAIDCFEGKVYWSDVNFRAIKSSIYNGSSISNFITNGMYVPCNQGGLI